MSIKLTFDFTNEAEAMAFLKKVSLAEAPADPTPAKPAKAPKPAKSRLSESAPASAETVAPAPSESAAPAAASAPATETELRAALTKLQSTKGLDVAKAILAKHGGTVSACLKLGAQNKVIAECAKAQ